MRINDLVIKIRADLSNLRTGNGNSDTVHGRINARLDAIDLLVNKHEPEDLGETILHRIIKVREQYSDILEKAA